MESRIAEELKLRYQPVAVVFTDNRPDNALQFTEGRWGCAVAMLSAAAKGKTAVFDRNTAGCMGGKVGLPFGMFLEMEGNVAGSFLEKHAWHKVRERM